MTAAEVLHADIVAEDDASAQFRKVRDELERLRQSLHHVNHEVHEEAVGFAFLAERFEPFGEHLGELRERSFELGEGLSEILPMLEVFGAFASIGGLVEMTHETAEARTQLSAMAETLGVTTERLEGYRLAARETDVPVEDMQNGLIKLQRAMAEGASGKNKAVVEIFGRMGVALRDAHGQLRPVSEVLPLIAESLSQTTNSTLKTNVAVDLFGKSGAKLIPMLNLGRAGIEKLQQVSEHLSAHLTGEQKEGIEKYKNSWIELDAAFDGLKDTITSDLAPVLTPIVEQIRDWTAANKDWIGATIHDDLVELKQDLQNIHLRHILDDVREAAGYANGIAKLAGGWTHVLEALTALAAIKLVMSVAGPVIELGKLVGAVGTLSWELNHKLVGAWRHVGKAAEGAGLKETAAASIGGGAGGLLGKGEKAVAKEGEELAAHEVEGEAKKGVLRTLASEAGGFGLKTAGKAAVAVGGLAIGGLEIAGLTAVYEAWEHRRGLMQLLEKLPPNVGALGPVDLSDVGPPPAPPPSVPRPPTADQTDVPLVRPKPLTWSKPAAATDDDEGDDADGDPAISTSSGGKRAAAAASAAPGSLGSALLNIRFENAPSGLVATLTPSGNIAAGWIDYGTNKPAGGF